MMISGAINTTGPGIPASLQSHFVQRSCCVLTNDEILSFQQVFSALETYSSRHPFPPEMLCVLVYTDQPSITLIQDPDVLGQSLCLATIWLGRIRQRPNYNPGLLMLVMAEELFHALYSVQNEYLVKEMVFEALQPYFPDLSLHDAYPLLFDEAGNRIPLPEYPAAWATRP
ncbi:MAG: hypothetical protein K5919_05090 [Clostridiales bacterium]|nr:hypothetical protein [Clostridiales bacterium]